MKGFQICKKKHKDQLILETEEPDRLTHPEDYVKDEVTLLPQDPELKTYPVCGTVGRNMVLFNNSLIHFLNR